MQIDLLAIVSRRDRFVWIEVGGERLKSDKTSIGADTRIEGVAIGIGANRLDALVLHVGDVDEAAVSRVGRTEVIRARIESHILTGRGANARVEAIGVGRNAIQSAGQIILTRLPQAVKDLLSDS